jgi:hypothetical protein
MHALILTYTLARARAAEHAELCEQLAPSFAAVPGLRSATRLTNEATGRYGCFFVFESRSAFDSFVASELFDTFRGHSGIADFDSDDFTVPPTVTSARQPIEQH